MFIFILLEGFAFGEADTSIGVEDFELPEDPELFEAGLPLFPVAGLFVDSGPTSLFGLLAPPDFPFEPLVGAGLAAGLPESFAKIAGVESVNATAAMSDVPAIKARFCMAEFYKRFLKRANCWS